MSHCCAAPRPAAPEICARCGIAGKLVDRMTQGQRVRL